MGGDEKSSDEFFFAPISMKLGFAYVLGNSKKTVRVKRSENIFFNTFQMNLSEMHLLSKKILRKSFEKKMLKKW